MRQKYKPWAEPYLIANEERMITSPSAVDNYNNYHQHILEIGMGKGDFLLRMAKVYEETYFVGVELNKTCGAIAMKKIIEENIPNVYFYIGNASNLEEVLPSKMKFDAIYLNFGSLIYFILAIALAIKTIKDDSKYNSIFITKVENKTTYLKKKILLMIIAILLNF